MLVYPTRAWINLEGPIIGTDELKAVDRQEGSCRKNREEHPDQGGTESRGNPSQYSLVALAGPMAFASPVLVTNPFASNISSASIPTAIASISDGDKRSVDAAANQRRRTGFTSHEHSVTHTVTK
jgi:hypothetical protein